MNHSTTERRRTLSGAVCAIFGLLAAGAASAEPPMWRVAGPHATVSIFGVVPPSMVGDAKWKTPALERATMAAQEVWFEAPLGLPGPITAIRLMSTLTTQGWLPDGQKLSAKLSPDAAARLARVAGKAGVTMEKIDRMKPWRADVELALARKEGTLKPGAVEQYVISAAKSAPRHGFDNMEEDLKDIVSAPPNEQIANLERALSRYENPAENHRYAEAWVAGDLNWVEKNRADPMRIDAPTIYQRLRVDRPRRWVDQIAKMAQGSRNVLVVVEIANLVGPDGVPALLRKRGMTVEGP